VVAWDHYYYHTYHYGKSKVSWRDLVRIRKIYLLSRLNRMVVCNATIGTRESRNSLSELRNQRVLGELYGKEEHVAKGGIYSLTTPESKRKSVVMMMGDLSPPLLVSFRSNR